MKSLLFWKRWWPTTHTGYVLLCIVILSLGALGRSARRPLQRPAAYQPLPAFEPESGQFLGTLVAQLRCAVGGSSGRVGAPESVAKLAVFPRHCQLLRDDLGALQTVFLTIVVVRYRV